MLDHSDSIYQLHDRSYNQPVSSQFDQLFSYHRNQRILLELLIRRFRQPQMIPGGNIYWIFR